MTFLFTEVVGMSRLWLADETAMSSSLRAHDETVREAIERQSGEVFTTAGDAFCAAFGRPADAARATVGIQRRLAELDWPGPALEVRIGIHTGRAELRADDYFVVAVAEPVADCAVEPSPRDPGSVSHPRSDAALLATTLLAITASVLPVFLTGAVAVQVRRDLSFSEAGLGVAVAVFFAAAACTSIVGGRLTQRLGAAVALRTGLALAVIVDVAIAVQARSLASLCVLLAIAGVGNAITQPAANLLLADHLPTDRLGFAIGLKQSGMPFATLLGGLAVPILAQTLGWESAYVAAAVVAVVAMVLVSGDRTSSSSPGPREVPDTPGRVLALLAFGMFFGAGAASALGSFLVSSAEASGLSSGQAGLLLAAGSACGITARVTLGAHADRHPGHHLLTVAKLLTSGAGAFALLAIHASLSSVIGTVLAFTTGWAWPGLFNLAVVRANPRAAGSATGITQTGVYLGAFTGPLVFGVVVEEAGYSTAWLVITGAALAAAAVFVVGDRRLERRPQEARVPGAP